MVPGCCSATGNTAGLQMPECFVQVLAHAPGKSVGVGFGYRRVVGRKRVATGGRWLPSLRMVRGRFKESRIPPVSGIRYAARSLCELVVVDGCDLLPDSSGWSALLRGDAESSR